MDTDAMVTAYHAASQAFAAMGARGLLASHSDDPDVCAVVLEANSDGTVSVTLIGQTGHPIGGYSL